MTENTSSKTLDKSELKRKRSIIDALYVKLLRDPSTNVIIAIVSVVFILWMVIPLILILSGAFYIPNAANTIAFKDKIMVQGQQNIHQLEINGSQNIGKIKIFLQQPEDTDFDLSIIDNQGRRTGGRTNESSTANEIINSKYDGISSKHEEIVIKSPDLPDEDEIFWSVICYSATGTGEYTINIAIYLEKAGTFSFNAFGNVFNNPKFFDFKGDSSTSFFSKTTAEEFGGFASNVIIDNEVVYVGEGYEGIEVLNISDSSQISQIRQLKFEGISITDMEKRDDLIYASDTRQGLIIANTSNIEEEFPIVSITPLNVNKTEFITIDGDFAYLDYQDDGFLILNISDPYLPEIVGNATIEQDSDDLAVIGNYAYLIGSNSRIMIFDVSDKSNPVLIERVESLSGIELRAKQIEIVNNFAYLAMGTSGFTILNISDYSNISLIDHYDFRTDNINYFDNKIFLSAKEGNFNNIKIFDVSNPLNVSEISSYNIGITTAEEIVYDSEKDLIAVAYGGNGLLLLDANNFAELVEIDTFQDNQVITTIQFVGVSRGNVLNTIILGLVTTIISVVLGTALAFVLARYEFPGKKVFSLLALAPLIIPPFISGMGFRFFLGPSGLLNTFFLIPAFNTRLIIEGFVAICFVQSFHFYALVYLNAFSSFVNVDPSMEEQAENLGAGSFRLFFTVTLPLALPGIGAGAILVLILSMEDVGTPIIFVGMGDNFGRKFLTYYIFSNFQLSGSNIITPEVCVLGGILLVIAIVGFLIIRRYVSLKQYAMISKGRAGQYRLTKAKWKLLFIYPFLIILFVLSLIVHVGIILMSLSKTLGATRSSGIQFTFENYKFIFSSSQYNIPPFVKNTLLYSFAATILIVILGSLAAYVVSRKDFKGKTAFDSLVTIPIAIPGIVLALGYYRTFDWGTIFNNNPNSFNLMMNNLTSNLNLNPFVGVAYVLLVLSFTIRKFPFTVRAAYAGLQQTDKVLEESSFNLGASRLKTFARITAPMISLNVFAGSLVSFLYCLSEVSTTVFIITSETGGTLTWMMANQVNARFQIFCALGVILMLLQILSLFITNVVLGSRTEAITGI